MLAVGVERDERIRTLLEGVVDAGLQRGALSEVDRVPDDDRACEHRDVFAVAVIEVTRVAGRFTGGRGLDVLPPPPIGVRVAAFGLVGGDRGAEEKAVGKPQRVTHPAECIPPDLSETSPVGLWAKPKVDKVPGWI